MKPVVCPTVTAYEPHEFREQLERVTPFAERIHFDLMDGEFAPTRSIAPIQIYWPDSVVADIHLMYRRPAEQIETIISLKPSLLIVHAEAEGNLRELFEHVHKFGIKTGVALLPRTGAESIAPNADVLDHVLLFSGDLGKFGGTVDTTILRKIPDLKALNGSLELGWDGGINDSNARILKNAGITVFNVGGFIQRSHDPATAYTRIMSAVT